VYFVCSAQQQFSLAPLALLLLLFSSEEQAGLTVQHISSLGNESYWADDIKIFRWPLIDGKK